MALSKAALSEIDDLEDKIRQAIIELDYLIAIEKVKNEQSQKRTKKAA